MRTSVETYNWPVVRIKGFGTFSSFSLNPLSWFVCLFVLCVCVCVFKLLEFFMKFTTLLLNSRKLSLADVSIAQVGFEKKILACSFVLLAFLR